MDLEIVGSGQGTQGLDLGRLIDGSQLCRLGERKHPGAGIVDIAAFGDEVVDRVGREFAFGTRAQENLGPVGEKFRCPAFVGFDVGGFVANDAVIRTTERGKGEGIGRRAVENKKDLAVRFENLPEEVGRFAGAGIIAIRGRKSRVGFGEGLPRFGANAGGVVTGKFPAGKEYFFACGGWEWMG